MSIDWRNSWSVEGDLSKKLLTYTLSEKEIEWYQLKMLQKNNILGVFRINHIIEGQGHRIIHNITGYISFKEYINEYGMNYAILELLVSSLINAIKEGQDYLIPEKALIMEPDKIFISDELDKIKFVCLPCKKKFWNNRAQFFEFIQYLLSYVNKKDEKAIALLHQLRIILEDQKGHLSGIENLLSYERFNQNTVADKLIPKDINTNTSNLAFEKQNTKKYKPTDAVITFIILQILMIVMILLFAPQWISQAIEHSTRHIRIMSLIGFLSISELIIFKKILIRNSKRDPVIKSKKTIKNLWTKGTIPVKPVVQDKPINSKWQWDNEDYLNLIEEKTTQKKDERAYIIDSAGIHIPIVTSPFIIGKMKSVVDYAIQYELISRVHCQVISREGQYYILDLESRNGTWLNQEKLQGHKEYLLTDSDLIHITDKEYIFKCL